MTCCSDCGRSEGPATGPLTGGRCVYCHDVHEKETKCYVCGEDATTSGVMGRLCGKRECDKADEVRTLMDYS